MTALNGAITLKEVNDVALAIAQNLDLNVLWLNDRSLKIHTAITEGCLCFTGSLGSLLAQLIFGFDEAHAASATTGDGLNKDREVEVLGVFHQLIDVRRWLRVLQRRQPSFLSGVHRGSLIAGQVKGARGRANELDAIVFTSPSEIRALR